MGYKDIKAKWVSVLLYMYFDRM